jgi:putative endonuclease
MSVQKKNDDKKLGIFGENLVAEYLIKKGYKIIATNFYYNLKLGEIDIIAKTNDTIAFVEVKTRSYFYAKINEMVPLKKQKKIIQTAELFLQNNKINSSDFIIRFDIAYVNLNNIEYFENAFNKI